VLSLKILKTTVMGQEIDQNEEQNQDRVFEHRSHKNDGKEKRDAEGRTRPKKTGNDARDRDIENDGGALGRNNGGDKSGR
jgi:hypothetical protein